MFESFVPPLNQSTTRTFSNNECNTDPTIPRSQPLSSRFPRKNILYLNSEIFQEEENNVNNKIRNLVLYFLQIKGIVIIHFENVFDEKILKNFCCDCNCTFQNLLTRIFFVCEEQRIIHSLNDENQLAPICISDFANITNAFFNTQKDIYLTHSQGSDNSDSFLPHIHEVPLVRFQTTKEMIHYLKDYLSRTQLTNHGSPLYYSSIETNLAYKKAASQLVEHTLNLFSREKINLFNYLNERNHNGPTKLVIEQSDLLIKIFQDISQTHTSDPSNTEKKYVFLNYEGIRFLNRKLTKELKSIYLKQLENFKITNNFGKSSVSYDFTYLMEAALNEMHLKDGDTMRLLETGNNDQTTPMLVAQQIHCILQYSQKKSISINIQVIIMGRGGHATTQMFPQFAHILPNKEFEGISEAKSLSQTLMHSLQELEISFVEVEFFSAQLLNIVQILLEPNSTNTGENIAGAVRIYRECTKNPKNIFVCTSTIRQILTFAQQYSENPLNPLSKKLCKNIFSIPYQRSYSFIENALTDDQAVLDFFANLCEQARRLLYAYHLDRPFIPVEPNDLKDLDQLYEIYDLLSETNDLRESKKLPISEILIFFQQRFQIMENAIPWNKDPSLQKIATQNAMKELLSRYQKKADFKGSLSIYEEIKDTALTADDKKYINVFSELLQKVQNDQTPNREKLVCFHLMAGMRNRLSKIQHQ